MSRTVASSVVALVLSACVASAEPPTGTRFDVMPVGCKIHGTYSDGRRVVDEYVGLKRGRYVVKTSEDGPGKALIRTTFYNADGWMVEKRWATGQRERFAPFSCFDKPGACTYVYTNIDGDRKTFQGKVTPSGKNLISTGGFVGEAPFPPARVRKGSFNEQVFFDDGALSFRVTKYAGCDLSG